MHLSNTLFYLGKDLVRNEIISARSDGNRTILHVAVMNAFATATKDDSDTADIVVEEDRKILTEQHGAILNFFAVRN